MSIAVPVRPEFVNRVALNAYFVNFVMVFENLRSTVSEQYHVSLG